MTCAPSQQTSQPVVMITITITTINHRHNKDTVWQILLASGRYYTTFASCVGISAGAQWRIYIYIYIHTYVSHMRYTHPSMCISTFLYNSLYFPFLPFFPWSHVQTSRAHIPYTHCKPDCMRQYMTTGARVLQQVWTLKVLDFVCPMLSYIIL